jgi:2-polyprenyl-6-methoxyphenol hydroxylase-like FAD-dependent oxidoreductase
MPKTLIIGAGLAGLTLAHGLRQDGWDVDVYERADSADAQPASYGIHLNADGLRALHACLPRPNWDLLDAAATPTVDRVTFRGTGMRVLTTHDNDATGQRRDPIAGRRGIVRDSLRHALLHGLDHGDGVVRWGKQFLDYRHLDDGTIEARFADGSHARGDVLVGADGSNSRVRSQRLPDIKRLDLNITNIAGRVPLTPELSRQLPQGLLDGSVNNFVPSTPGWLFVSTWTAASSSGTESCIDDPSSFVVWAWAAANASYPSEVASMSSEALHDWVIDRVSNWAPGMQALVASTDPATVSAITLKTMPPLPHWQASTTTLIGDAIHNMTPMAGIGANTALRDAALLRSHLTAAGPADLTTRIGAYEKQMRIYANDALAQSTRNARNAASEGRLPRIAFRTALRLAEAMPPIKRAMFGHRPTQGDVPPRRLDRVV